MAFHQINGIKIRTSFDYPPIPVRSFDWSAVDDNTYDCDCDQDGFFSTSPVGHGATEQDAIADLLEQIADGETETPPEGATNSANIRDCDRIELPAIGRRI